MFNQRRERWGQSHLVEYHTAVKMNLLEVARINMGIYKKHSVLQAKQVAE